MRKDILFMPKKARPHWEVMSDDSFRSCYHN